MNNAIMMIKPYKFAGMWVFDDEQTGLIREPFVAGADDIIDVMVASIPNAENGFALTFSNHRFPGHDLELDRRQEEDGGWWYHSPILDMEGWLCPAMFHYFDEAPPKIYCKFREIK